MKRSVIKKENIKRKGILIIGVFLACIVVFSLLFCRMPYSNLKAETISRIYVITFVNEESTNCIIDDKKKVEEIIEYIDKLYFVRPIEERVVYGHASKSMQLEFIGEEGIVATYSVSNDGHICVNEKRSLGTTFNAGKYEEVEKIIAECK